MGPDPIPVEFDAQTRPGGTGNGAIGGDGQRFSDEPELAVGRQQFDEVADAGRAGHVDVRDVEVKDPPE